MSRPCNPSVTVECAEADVTAALTNTDPWATLRTSTAARIGLGRSGNAIPMKSVLAFQMAHANARDAVHTELDVLAVEAALAPLPVVHVRSSAPDRTTYLKRPDLGRVLSDDPYPGLAAVEAYDIVFVVADGLSATAVQSHSGPLVHACLANLPDLRVAPVIVATQARVAIGDPIGQRLNARVCVLVIGERPGLSVSDSVGIYLTFNPRPGRRDSERNCISNIHGHGGLTYAQAASKTAWLVREALARGLSGVNLKDGIAAATIGSAGPRILAKRPDKDPDG